MTYKDLKMHCDKQLRCADCKYEGCDACKDLEELPCYFSHDDPRLGQVIPASHLRRKRDLRKYAKAIAGIVVGVALVMAVWLGVAMLVRATSTNVERTEATATQSMFVEVESTNRWYVVYHRETRVMYAVSRGEYDFTLLVNPDGTPMIYNE